MTIPVPLNRFIEFHGEPLWAVHEASSTLSGAAGIAVFVVARRAFVQRITRTALHD
jgi:ABC-type glycerol-3-phosphate transport system permease component